MSPEPALPAAGRSYVPVRVMLADDHELWRAAVRRTLESAGIEVVGEASTLDDAAALAGSRHPDVILLDTSLSGIGAPDLLAALAPVIPSSRIVMLSASSEDHDVLEALRHGAVGYLTKDIPQEALVRAVRDAHAGGLAMSRAMAAMVLGDLMPAAARHDARSRRGPLTARQEEILACVAEGMSDSAIADRLTLSSRTVEGHVGAIIRKLGARDRAHATRLWFGRARERPTTRRFTHRDAIPRRH